MFRIWMGVIFALAAVAHSATAQDAGRAAETDLAGIGTADAQRISGDDVRAAIVEMHTLLRAQAQQLEMQRQQLERQQSEIEQLRREVAAGRAGDASAAEQELAAAAVAAHLSTEENAGGGGTDAAPVSVQPAVVSRNETQSAANAGPTDSPLSIHHGKASLTPGGWVDLTAYARSTNVGSGLGTAFAAIPFNNTVQGGLSETRFSAQGSRISLRADESLGATRVFGYAEADFSGYLPSNAYVSTNSDSMRLRVYFVDLRRGRWEVLGGQSWSLLTPNRTGVSPFLSEIYNTLHLDTNYQVGLTYARQAQLRAVYHFNGNVALGLSAENPEQFSGNAVTFPTLFSTSETDLGSASGAGGGTATPTLHPDIIAKLSADAGWGGRAWHFETAGLLTPVAIFTPASVTKTASAKDVREGGGISGSANLEVLRNLHLIVSGFWSDGGGRYLGGLGPGFVVAQPGSAASPFVAQLLHSGSGIASAEWHARESTVLSLTYSGAYFARASSIDPSTGKLVGYGFAGSSASDNRAFQEGTFATQTTLWQRSGYGSVLAITQASYIVRTPWYAAPDAPRNAHVFAGYANLRYVLP